MQVAAFSDSDGIGVVFLRLCLIDSLYVLSCFLAKLHCTLGITRTDHPHCKGSRDPALKSEIIWPFLLICQVQKNADILVFMQTHKLMQATLFPLT